MATTIKMTETAKYDALKALITDETPNADILREFCDKKKEQLRKKSAGSAEKAAEKAAALSALSSEISAILGQAGRPLTATEIFKASTANSVQAVTHALRSMLASGDVMNDREGKTSLYYLPAVEVEADTEGEEAEAVTA